MMHERRLRGLVLLVVTCAVIAWSATALGHEFYSGCITCHPQFQDEGPLHDLHVGSSQMTDNCFLCHTSIGDTPSTMSSGGVDGQGCRGCHGVDNGTLDEWTAGLRKHHENEGITSCLPCHPDDPGSILPEDTLPVYYSRADVNIDDPCATTVPGGEDWDGDGEGLDNDGDLVYDGDDPDCIEVGVEEATPVSPRALVLYSIAPNPVKVGGTDVTFGVTGATDVRVGVFDVTGRRIADALVPVTSAGAHAFHFDGKDESGQPLASGVYVVRIETDSEIVRGRFVIIR
jgi:hypothetical protein